MTPETNPMPSQSARDAAAMLIDDTLGDTKASADRTRNGEQDYHWLVQALHAAEQRGMEKAADEVERLRAALKPFAAR